MTTPPERSDTHASSFAWRPWLGVALVIAAFSPLSSLPTRSLHVGFLLLLAFLIHPVSAAADRRRIVWYDALLAALRIAWRRRHPPLD